MNTWFSWPGSHSTSGSVAVVAVDRDPVAPARLEQPEAHLEALVQVDRLARRLAEAREAAQVLHDGRRALGAARHDADDLLRLAQERLALRGGAAAAACSRRRRSGVDAGWR